MKIVQIKELKIGDIVSITYKTYNNNEPKPRKLSNLKVTEILNESVKFIQQTKGFKKYWINNEDILKVQVFPRNEVI